MAIGYRLRIKIKQVEDGYYLATSNDLPGLVVQERSVDETIESAVNVAQELITCYKQQGDPLPPGLKVMNLARSATGVRAIPSQVNAPAIDYAHTSGIEAVELTVPASN